MPSVAGAFDNFYTVCFFSNHLWRFVDSTVMNI